MSVWYLLEDPDKYLTRRRSRHGSWTTTGATRVDQWRGLIDHFGAFSRRIGASQRHDRKSFDPLRPSRQRRV